MPKTQTRNKAKKVNYRLDIVKASSNKIAAIAQDRQQIIDLNMQRKVTKLVVMGQTYDSIAEKLGISTKEAYDYTKEAIKNWTQELALSAEEARELEIKRLDAMIAMLMPRAFPHPIISEETGLPIRDAKGKEILTDPDITSCKLILEIVERKSRFMGLDAADKLKEKMADTLIRKYIGVDPDAL